MNNFVAFSMFTILFDHHVYLVLEHFHHPPKGKEGEERRTRRRRETRKGGMGRRRGRGNKRGRE